MIDSSASTFWSLSRSPNTIQPSSHETASQSPPLALGQIVTRAFVVIAVLRAMCIEETKSLTAPVCLAFDTNMFIAGTAIEAPMRIVYQIDLIQGGRSIPEPQYEADRNHQFNEGKTVFPTHDIILEARHSRHNCRSRHLISLSRRNATCYADFRMRRTSYLPRNQVPGGTKL